MSGSFEDAGTSPGLQIWRVEQMTPVPHDEVGTTGKLFSGDCYLFLHTVAGPTGGLTYSIYFWLGESCSADEAGAAAMFAAELDQAMGGAPSICRNVQGAETAEFLKLFPKGVLYEEGGVATGFKSPEESEQEPKLYHLSGGKSGARIQSVACSPDSLNSGECFVLDTQKEAILQWIGKDSHSSLKYKTLEFANKVRDDLHAGVARIGAIDQGDTTSADADVFYRILGVEDPSGIQIAAGPPPSSKPATDTKLYAVPYTCDDGIEEGWPLDDDEARAASTYTESRTQQAVLSHRLQEVDGTPSAAMLKADAVFVLLGGGSLWVWLGKFAPIDMRTIGMSVAEKVAAENELPSSTPIQVIKQGLEGPLFKQCFPDWDKLQAEALAKEKAGLVASNSDADTEPTAVDVAAMAASKPMDEPSIDDGTGAKQVWRVNNFELEELPDAEYGNFNAGDCYIVLYQYGMDDAPQYILYMWQGSDSSTDERGACAIQAVQVDDKECANSAVQVRVVQGKELKHFVDMWQGNMVVHKGGIASGFKTLAEEDETGGATRLYHIKSSSSGTPQAVEVEATASCLNSGDVFVLVTPDTVWTWRGKFSVAAEQSSGEAMVQRILAGAAERQSMTVAEGSEPGEFWTALGGEAEYSELSEVAVQHAPRLFQVNDARTGGEGVSVEEVHNFSQDDLYEEDVMLLDTHTAVFLWVGSASSANEQKGALALVDEYLASTGRDSDTPVTIVKSGTETANFTGYFHGWDDGKQPTTAADYEKRIAELRAQMPPKEEPELPSWAKNEPDYQEEEVKPDATPEVESQPAAKEEPPEPEPESDSAPVPETPEPPAEDAGAESADVAADTTERAAVSNDADPADIADRAFEPEAETANTEATAVAAEASEPAAEPSESGKEGAMEAEAMDAQESVPKDASGTAATEESPAAAPSTPEPSVLPSGISAAQESQSGDAKPELMLPVSHADSLAPVTAAKPLTPHTQRGVWEHAPIDPSGTKGTEVKFTPGEDVFPIEQLRDMRGADGIDPSVKEQYLSEEEFQQLFNVDRAAFQKLPLWRRQAEKKKVGLF